MWQSLYASPWHHPGVVFAGGALALLVLVVLRPRLWRLGALMVGLSLIDATLTGALSPLPHNSAATFVLAFVFVLLGDARVFYLVARQALPRAVAGVVAVGTAMFAPLAVLVLKAAAPRLVDNERAMFLSYELVFCVVALALLVMVRRGFGESPALRRWLTWVAALTLAQYAAWAAADVVISLGHDAGYALRLVPNFVYYVAFAPLAVLTAPPEARA